MNTSGWPPSSRTAEGGWLRCSLWSIALVLSALASFAAHADVPGRVGRIAFMEGDVQAYSETDPTWKVAYVNQPITSRNSVFVGDVGRAEISVGSTTLAMDAGSQVDIQQLDDNTFNANVVRGRVSMRVGRFDPSDVYNVAAPGADFALLKPGRYRIDALESASGITVFAGQAGVQGDRGEQLVQAGNALRVEVDPSDPNAAPQLLSAAPVALPLDDWVVARDNRFRDSQAERYVSPNMTGYEDLDANGRWATETDVGPVWYPTTYVQADWAPYRYGRWAYVEPWGYTWIDDAPWGFAPFHYGRWIQVGNRWGWAPGAYVARPVYAPALVGFYGGAGFSASFSVGSRPAVGWYPLAPWQRYSPHYTQNAGYLSRVNNNRSDNAPQRFGGGEGGRDYWNREHGGTLVPRAAFSSQRSISRIATAAPRNAFERGAPVNVGQLPRPEATPGAVRRGPEGGNGDARPQFRSPRDFAARPIDAGRGVEPGNRGPAAVVNGASQQDGRGLPPGYRRLPEDRRQDPVVAGQADRAVQPRGPNSPSLNRDGRPSGDGPGQQPRMVTPRVQPSFGNEADPQRPQFVQPAQVERPNREFRNTQQPQPFERQQQAERQQQFQQQQVERQQQQVQRQQQQAERQQQVQQQQVQRQQGERQQRAERPAPAAQPRPQPPAGPVMEQHSLPPLPNRE
ncbi:MAG: DUF6600 domain-containing protein [Burkholderiaceae bacterium]